MKLGVTRDVVEEHRVAIVPGSLRKLTKAGYDVLVERAGDRPAPFPDPAYEAAGARLVDAEEARRCDVVVSLRPQDPATLGTGAIHCCIADPFRKPDSVRACLASGITLMSMDMIPRRLSRAQSMDVNSSQDSLVGYKSVLLGAHYLGKAIPMMTTPAGTVRPARFVIMGSGVAGLQAIATAKRLGAVVHASDVRLAAKEQIESVGGRFIHVDGMEDFEDAAGYAKPLTPEFVDKVNRVVNEVAQDADVVITTARIFGRPAPITVPADAVAEYRHGAVVVDINADVGGNCELTQPGEVYTTEGGVTVVGLTNLAGMIPVTASTLFSNNMTQFLLTLIEDGKPKLDLEDPILVGAPEGDPLHVPDMGGVLVCHEGALHERQARLKGVIQ